MSFLGNLLKIIAIGAFFIATGPFSLHVGKVLATVLRIGGVVLGYLGALADKPQLIEQRLKLTGTTLEPHTAIPVVYGRAKVGGIVADWFLNPTGGQKDLYYVAVYCHGSRDGLGIAGVDEIWLDNRLGINPVTGVRSFPYRAGTANYKIFLGSTVQNVGATPLFTDGSGSGILAPASVGGSTWNTTTDLGTGLCIIGFVFRNVDTTVFFSAGLLSSSVANPTVITTSGTNTFQTGDVVDIKGHTGSTPSINGRYTLTVLTSNTFTIPVNVTVGGIGGTATLADMGPVFHGPPATAAIVRGNRVYDHNLDAWVAGRDNPAWCIRDYLLSPIYGCGYTDGLLNEASFVTAAAYCDVTVSHKVGTPVTITSSSVANPTVITTTTPHGWASGILVRIAGHTGSTPSLNNDYTITVTGASTFTVPVNVTIGGSGGTATKLVQTKRFTCNGVLDTSRATSENLQELLSSCRGNLVWQQGQFTLSIRSADGPAPVLALTPSNIIGEWSFRNAGLEEKWNTVKVTYIEPAAGEFKTQEVQWPPLGASNAYLTADGGFTNRLDLALPFTNDQLIAQDIAQVTLNEARLGITCQVRCTEEALQAAVGDQVTITHPTPGWTAKPFWVTAIQLMPDTTVALSLQEYDPTAYDLSTIEDRRTFTATEHDSIFTVPAPASVTGTPLQPQGILIAWPSAAYGFVDYYDVQARNSGAGEEYVTVSHVREFQTLQATVPLARPGQTWLVRVRTVNTAGWPSAWVESASIVIPEPAATCGTGTATYTGYAPTITIVPPSPDLTAVNRTDVGGNLCSGGSTKWTQTISWTVTSPDDANFRIDLDMATDAAGTSFSALITGLTTVSSSYDHDTGVLVRMGGAINSTLYYRKYRVKLVRISDSVEIEHLDTSQDTLQSTTNCPFP